MNLLRIIIKLIFMSTIGCIISCTEKTDNTQELDFFTISYDNHNDLREVKKYFNEDRKTIRKRFFLFKDSVVHGSMEFFNSKGKLIKEINYDMGLRHGPFKKYNPKNGKLIEYYNYNSGSLIDTIKLFYDNGGIKRTIPIRDGDKHGRGFNYDINGEVSSYIHFFKNDVKYRVDYDSLGNILNEGGTLLPIVYVNKIDLIENEELVIDFQIYSAPHASPDLLIGELDEKLNFKENPVKIILEEHNCYTLKQSFLKKGKYIIGAKVISNSSILGAKEEELFHVEVNVTD